MGTQNHRVNTDGSHSQKNLDWVFAKQYWKRDSSAHRSKHRTEQAERIRVTRTLRVRWPSYGDKTTTSACVRACSHAWQHVGRQADSTAHRLCWSCLRVRWSDCERATHCMQPSWRGPPSTHVCMYVNTWMHMHSYGFVYVWLYICTCMPIHASVACCRYVHIYIYIYIYIYIWCLYV
jgi:hypothetical protein